MKTQKKRPIQNASQAVKFLEELHGLLEKYAVGFEYSECALNAPEFENMSDEQYYQHLGDAVHDLALSAGVELDVSFFFESILEKETTVRFNQAEADRMRQFLSTGIWPVTPSMGDEEEVLTEEEKDGTAEDWPKGYDYFIPG